MNIQNNEEKESKQRIINIFPSKWTKRFLTLLGDLCFVLITSVFLLEFVTQPIAKLITDFGEESRQLQIAMNSRMQIMYDNELLFYEKEEDKFKEQLNLVTTCDRFISYYAYEENPKNEIVFHYFNDIRHDDINKINEIYKRYGVEFFDLSNFTSIGTYALKENVKDLIRPKFTEGDELSEDGKNVYYAVQNQVFLNLYQEVLIDIKKNDLTSPTNDDLTTFNSYLAASNKFNDYYQNLLIATSTIAFLISDLIYLLIIPLCNHKGQTLSERILKTECVDKKTIQYLSKKDVFIKSLFDLFNSSTVLFAVPCISLGFSGLFSLPYLFGVSLIGLLFLIIEGIVFGSTKLNQSLKQLGTHSIYCDEATIDEYYRELGYE